MTKASLIFSRLRIALRRVYVETKFKAIGLKHFLRALFTRKPVFLIASHTGQYIGNAYYFLRYVHSRPEVCGLGLASRQTRYSLVHDQLPWVVQGSWPARCLARRAAAVFIGGYPSSEPFISGYARALRVLTWHGMPIKAIGAQSTLQPPGNQGADCCIATSPFTQEIMHRAFPAGGEVLCTGEPKTDGLVDPDRPDVRQKLGNKYQKMVHYAPTFRDAANPTLSGYFADPNFDDSIVQSEQIRDSLERHKACMVVAPHPAVRMHYKGRLRPPYFLATDLDLSIEHLMAAADYLISDYSSVIIDWLLLLRPMGLYCPDIDEYESRRGFPYFDYQRLLGKYIHTELDSLAENMNRTLGESEPDHDMQALKILFHRYEAGGAAQRLFEAIWLEWQTKHSKGQL